MGTEQARGISLHIGVNRVDPEHYAGWSGELASCEFDAEDLRDLAAAEGFTPTLLLTTQATRTGVTEAITAAAETLREGDMFFLSYSGHGGQVPDMSWDEADSEDETWCLYDGQLVDDELYLLWTRFAAGVRILVLSDSCHSGTVIRNDPRSGASLAEPLSSARYAHRVTRHMPSRVAAQTYRGNRDTYDGIADGLPQQQPEVRAHVQLISGCQDDQLSADGTFNGLFTGRLLQVWRSGRFEGSYRDLHAAVAARMPSDQTPNLFSIGAPCEAFAAARPFSIGAAR